MPVVRLRSAGFLVVACLTALSGRARAVDLFLRAEPAVGGPLSEPQSRNFGVGGGALLGAGLTLTRFLGAHATAGFLGFESTAGDPTTITVVGAGLRLERPHAAKSISPWLDATALYVRTGDLDRFGFAVGAGAAYPVGRERRVWLGLWARYLQIVQEPAPSGYYNSDAKILIGGLSVQVDRVFARAQPAGPYRDPNADTDKDGVRDGRDKCPAEPGPADNAGCPYPDKDGDGVNDRADKCPTQPGPASNAGCPDTDSDGDGVVDREDLCPQVAGDKAAGGCPDRDHDTVTDAEDVCPDVAGEPANHGCPKYLRVTVTEDKLELSQKVFFAWDGDTVLEKSYPLLDEVAQALKDHPTLSVRIEGHTDNAGRADHNMRLSMRRARAVRDYLVAHGIAGDRLEAVGFGSEQPLATNATFEGRERNRRVEFVITKKK